MTVLADALAKSKRPEFLIEVTFGGGTVWRCARRTTTVSDGASSARVFDTLIRNDFSIETSLDLDSLRYSLHNIFIEISNRNRLQDAESSELLDGGRARIYVWTPGLDWADIETAGLIAEGTFYKESHDSQFYRFNILDEVGMKFGIVPRQTISATTWPNHRTAGGSGSIAGLAQPLVFGDWNTGVPLLCIEFIDSTSYRYLAMQQPSLSTDGEYNAGTEDVFDKDGTVIDPANYVFSSQATDGLGNPCAIFDFGSTDQTDSEPLTCSIRGIYDGSGEVTGTAGALIEHPADIVYYLARTYSSLSPTSIDLGSIRSMRSLLPGAQFRVMINQRANALEVIDRILEQCTCARIHRGGRTGIFTFHPTGPITTQLGDNDLLSTPVFSKTPIGKLLTSLRVTYIWNPSTGGYEGEFTLDRTNNPVLRRAFQDYGDQPEQTLELRDVGQEGVARQLATRYIALYGVRHDVVRFDLPYHLAIDIREGDKAALTLIDGPSGGGAGWVEHEAILLERKFSADRISTTWLNPRLIEIAISGLSAPPEGEEPPPEEEGGPPFIDTDTGFVDTDTIFVPT